jgi:hypothetical protein
MNLACSIYLQYYVHLEVALMFSKYLQILNHTIVVEN